MASAMPSAAPVSDASATESPEPLRLVRRDPLALPERDLVGREPPPPVADDPSLGPGDAPPPLLEVLLGGPDLRQAARMRVMEWVGRLTLTTASCTSQCKQTHTTHLSQDGLRSPHRVVPLALRVELSRPELSATASSLALWSESCRDPRALKGSAGDLGGAVDGASPNDADRHDGRDAGLGGVSNARGGELESAQGAARPAPVPSTPSGALSRDGHGPSGVGLARRPSPMPSCPGPVRPASLARDRSGSASAKPRGSGAVLRLGMPGAPGACMGADSRSRSWPLAESERAAASAEKVARGWGAAKETRGGTACSEVREGVGWAPYMGRSPVLGPERRDVAAWREGARASGPLSVYVGSMTAGPRRR